MTVRLLTLRDWLYIAIMIIIFPPGVVQAYTELYSFSLWIKCAVAILFFLYFILYRKTDWYINLIILFYTIQILSTLINNTDYLIESVREALCSMAIIFALYWIIKERKERILADLNILLQSYILLNFLLLLYNPEFFKGFQGSLLYQNNYFLGIKNQIALVLAPMTAFVIIYNFRQKGRKDLWSLIIIGISFTTEVLIDSSTGFIAFAFMLFLYVIVGEKSYKIMTTKKIISIFIIFNIALIFLQTILSIPAIQEFIIGILHRDVSLSNRTAIWGRALLRFKEHPVLGLGRQENKNMITFFAMNEWDHSTTYSTHNVMLQTLLESGLMGYIPLANIGLALVKKASTNKSMFYTVTNIGIATILISFLTEAYDLTYFFAISSFLLFSADKYNNLL